MDVQPSSASSAIHHQQSSEFPTLFEFARQRLTETQHIDLFLASIVAALSESDENPFCIDFNTAVEWLDVRKDHLKRVLLKKLRKNDEYKVSPQKGENPQGGRPTEVISLTVEGLKKLCLSTKGSRPDEVRQYFINVEKILVQYTIAQRDAEIEKLRARLPVTPSVGEGGPKSNHVEFRTQYSDVPSGPKVYRRLSLANYVDGIAVPPKSKLQRNEMKIGISRTDLSQRDQGYREDVGIFDRIITTESDQQAMTIEAAIKAAIKPFVTQNSQEYFSPDALVKGRGFDASGNAFDIAWDYGLAIAKSVEHSGITGIYDSEVIVDDATRAQDNPQRRVTDFFNTTASNEAVVKPVKRNVNVRFKLRETDVALKWIDVELLKETERTRRLEIDAKQREIDASVEKARIEADVEKARLNLAALKEQTRLRQIELKHAEISRPKPAIAAPARPVTPRVTPRIMAEVEMPPNNRLRDTSLKRKGVLYPIEQWKEERTTHAAGCNLSVDEMHRDYKALCDIPARVYSRPLFEEGYKKNFPLWKYLRGIPKGDLGVKDIKFKKPSFRDD